MSYDQKYGNLYYLALNDENSKKKELKIGVKYKDVFRVYKISQDGIKKEYEKIVNHKNQGISYDGDTGIDKLTESLFKEAGFITSKIISVPEDTYFIHETRKDYNTLANALNYILKQMYTETQDSLQKNIKTEYI